MMAYSIDFHLQYNAWANEKICSLLSKTDDAILKSENKSSFTSIAKTLTHIWDAEMIWLTRLEGVSLSEFPSVKFAGTLADIIELLKKTDRDLIELVRSKGNDFLASTYSYKNLKGLPFTDVVEYTLFHIVNHGTYHRGQIITMLREAGVKEVVSTDLILFMRTQNEN